MPLRGRIGAALILAGIVLVEVRRPSQAETAEVVTAST